MSIPQPGRPVRGSRTGGPVMAIFDLLGRRWAMGIVWQLSGGPLSFTELQARCATISPTILSTRIKDLVEARLVERCLDGYTLTPLGRELFAILEPFKDWARTWASALGMEAGKGCE